MGVDTLSPIAPVRFRALLLPIGKIKRSRFLSFASRLQAENVVRLGDISPDSRPNRNMFSPLAFPTGMILYDLSFSVPPTDHLELFPFETHREPLVVIAIADGTELSESKDASSNHPAPQELGQLQEELETLKDNHPRALVNQLLIFDYDGLDNITNGPENVLWVPRPEASKATTMKTVVCDVTSVLLSELDQFAKTIQNIPSIDSPRASSWGPTRQPELRSRLMDRVLNRMTLPAQMPSNPNGSLPDTVLSSKTASPAPSEHETPTTFDEITRSIHLTRTNSGGRSPAVASPKEHSRDRMSVSGLSATDRTKNRIKGRSGVVVGTLFLQAGRWPDALKELVEAANNARAASDYVWHAKSLENILICLVMHAWAGMDFQIPSILYPVADKASRAVRDALQGPVALGNRLVSLQNLTNLLPDLSNTIVNLYIRAANMTDEPLPQLIFSETVIRLSRLMVSARVRDGGLDDNALKHIVMNEPLLPLLQPELPRGTVLMRRSDIANFLYRALPLAAEADLPATDSVPIIAGVISVLNLLDLPRKKAFVLRELLTVIVPSLVQARKIGAAEAGIHPAAGLGSLNDTAFDVNALDIGHGNMEQSVRLLLASIGETYGAQPSASHEWQKRQSRMSGSGSEKELPAYDSLSSIVDRTFRHIALDQYGDLNLKVDVLKACINCCEALPDFDGVLRFTVELLQTIRGELMLSEGQRIPPRLPPDEQIRLLNNIKRTVDAGNRLGASTMAAEYWDDFLVRDVQLLPLPDARRPVSRLKTELDAATTTSEKAKKDPFLYNPFAKPSSKALEILTVTDEPASFRVTLQNPYEFEVDIESLRLEGEGLNFVAEAENIVIAPLSLQDVLILGTAYEEGSLTISGCSVKIRHCRERKFHIFKSVWRPLPEVKCKRTGLSAKQPLSDRPLSWSSVTAKDGKVSTKKGPETESCQVKVIGRQPSMIIESMSLSQSAVMLLEGEIKTFSITLQNTSACPVDFVLFTFQDSTTRQLQSALTNKNLQPVEIYELELKLATQPALRWRREGPQSDDCFIAAGGKATFNVDVLGKPGLQDTTVQIDYSYVNKEQNQLPDVFYTRQLFVPLTVTVNASVEVARCDILPFGGDFAWKNNLIGSSASTEEACGFSVSASVEDPFSGSLTRLGNGAYGSDHCIVLLDVRNVWPSPLSVWLRVNEHAFAQTPESFKENNAGQYTVDGHLQPGQVSRFVLVLPRVYLDNPFASIPLVNTGNRRQYVVSANKLTFEAEGASREAFWFREELLKRVIGGWSEPATGRKGSIDLRNIRLNTRMVEAMRLEDVEVSFSLSGPESKDNETSVTQTGRSKFHAQTDDLLTLTVTVHNRSPRPIHPILRLQPSLRHQPNNIALDLTRRLAWTGMLQQALPVLPARESTKTTIGLTILCRGEYEVGASIEEARLLRPSEESRKGDGAGTTTQFREDGIEDTFGAGVVKRRRIWHAKEGCVILAHH
ncbi:Trafficking protein particle complex subunit 9 [Penicillium ucsense]|uniref:Trafficking protein particle complex subunit 9 n=1 Tax=Penicillium ucsense TaxID=2839758 RepID=A0A8J8VXC7_9EURO|nr:Trafficking protein particle complex subunit 9 [Penicillium ucsense]KAF7733036.1 Trafficking protein particle complex subunit 9 [Penicillium ucsense]